MPYVGGGGGSVARPSSGGGGITGFLDPTSVGNVLHDAARAFHYATLPIRSVVPDMIRTGENMAPGIGALIEHPIRSIEAMPGQMWSDLSNPKMWVEHPFQVGLDLLSVAPIPIGAAARVGALGDVLAGTSRLAMSADAASEARMLEAGVHPTQLGSSELGPQVGEANTQLQQSEAIRRAQASQQPVGGDGWVAHPDGTIEVAPPQELRPPPLAAPTFGKQVMRAVTFGQPEKLRPIISHSLITDPETGLQRMSRLTEEGTYVQLGKYYSRNPMNAWFQKHIDTFHELHPDIRVSGIPVRVPGLYKPQLARINAAQRLVTRADQKAARFASNELTRLEKGKTPGQMEANRLIGNLATAESKEAHTEKVMPNLSGQELKNNQAALERIRDAKQYLTNVTVKTPPTYEDINFGEPTKQAAEVKTVTGLPPNFLKFHRGKYKDVGGMPRTVDLNGAKYDRMMKHAQAIADGAVPTGKAAAKLSPAQVKALVTSAERTVERLKTVGRPADAHEIPFTPYKELRHSGGEYTIPILNKDHPDFDEMDKYVRQSRMVSNLRSHGFRDMGYLERSSEILRTLGPKSIYEGHGLAPNMDDLRRNLRLAENHPNPTDVTRARVESLKAQLDYWEHARGDLPGPVPEPPEGMGPQPLMDPALADMGYRVPEMAHLPRNAGEFIRAWKGGQVAEPASLRHAYEGIMEHHGYGLPATGKVIAASYQEYARFAYLTKLRERVLMAAQDTPLGIPEAFRKPIATAYWNGSLPVGWEFPKQMLEDAARSAPEAEGMGRWYDQLRNLMMEPSSALNWANQHGFPYKTVRELEQIPMGKGVKWIDSRMLGGLDKPNPLWSMMENSKFRFAMRSVDAINEIQKAMLLYLKPAYLLPNFMGNVGLALVHQGFLAPWNLGRTMKIMFTGKGLDPEVVSMIKSRMGAGIFGSLNVDPTIFGKISSFGNRLAGGYGRVIDDPFRFSAFLHEADAAGFSTAEDLHRLMTDSTLEPQLQEITIRANDALIDYENLSPGEQAIIRRAVFFYPWVKGSTKYGYQMIINHPGASSLSGQLADQGEEMRNKAWPGGVPDFLAGAMPIGGGRISNLASASILQQPADILNLAYNTVKSHPDPNVSITSQFSPADAFMYTLGTGQTSIPANVNESRPMRAVNEAFGGIPAISFAQGLINGFPQGQYNRLYPGDSLLTHVNQFLGMGSGSFRNFNAEKAALDVYRQKYARGYTSP